MKYRNNYGSANIVGINVFNIRKAKNISQKTFVMLLRENGLNINPSSYSKLEGQIRYAYDYEIFAIARILNVKIEDLFDYNT